MTEHAETLHASCVAIGGRGVLISGPSGSGKSDLALRLIDRGATLVSDDYTVVREGLASAPATIAGKIEVRGIGILTKPHATAPVAMLVRAHAAPARLPEPTSQRIAGTEVPLIELALTEPSAPVKVELALAAIA